MPLMFGAGLSARQQMCLLSNLTSFAFDYIARQKTGGTNLTFGVINQLPVLPPSEYEQVAPWSPGETVAEWMLARAAELVCTADDMAPLAAELGLSSPKGSQSRWDPERRFQLRCELDAAFFHLYGLSRDEVDHVMESFWVVRNRDEAACGEYRTKLAVLDQYDAMASAFERDDAADEGVTT